ncbi:hypothetical protein [Actinomadura sp. 3N407]|uniref:hypothetical protein n=1 Tax=Actinomadura sp. 3N407 TaxID=3457423 RepID=UPI003FCEAF64
MSIIKPDSTVMDYQLELGKIVPFLAHHGQSLVAALSAHPPYPLVHETLVASGAVIDLPARRLRYWTPHSVPPRLLADLTAAWPGWSVERLPLGYTGHVAVTGRPGDEELIVTDADLRTRIGWTEDLIEIWNDQRTAFPEEPRPLRPPRVRVIKDS